MMSSMDDLEEGNAKEEEKSMETFKEMDLEEIREYQMSLREEV